MVTQGLQALRSNWFLHKKENLSLTFQDSSFPIKWELLKQEFLTLNIHLLQRGKKKWQPYIRNLERRKMPISPSLSKQSILPVLLNLRSLRGPKQNHVLNQRKGRSGDKISQKRSARNYRNYIFLDLSFPVCKEREVIYSPNTWKGCKQMPGARVGPDDLLGPFQLWKSYNSYSHT